MELPDFMMRITTPEPLKSQIHTVRDQLVTTLTPHQRELFSQLEDLYTMEDAEHLTQAHTILAP